MCKKYLKQPHDLCTEVKGEQEVSDRSAGSVSPIGPPKAVHRRTKEKTRRPKTVLSKRYVRKLFPKSPSRVAANFLHGRQRVTINRKKEGVLAGPFMVNRDTSDMVVEMLKFVFMPRPLTAKMARCVKKAVNDMCSNLRNIINYIYSDMIFCIPCSSQVRYCNCCKVWAW